jgi:hypothetical protein
VRLLVEATLLSSSSADFDGYTSRLITLEDQAEGFVVQMAGPMLAVARLITEEQLNPRIDQVVQENILREIEAAIAGAKEWMLGA